MRMYGAKVILTPAAERGTGMVAKAEELAKKHGWFLPSQFANPAGPAYHRNTTAAEILSDFADERLDAFVTGWGTGGTLTGVGSVLRLARPEVQIIAVEPAGAAMLDGKPWTPHKIQGAFASSVARLAVSRLCAGPRHARPSPAACCPRPPPHVPA